SGVLIAGAIMLIFCQSDRKLQVMVTVWLASLAGAAGAYYLTPASPSRWFWSIPLICGLLGYIGTYFQDSGGWVIGEPRGFFAPLARPLPIDYAGAGAAGALAGYWLSRWWHLRRMPEQQQTGQSANR